MFDPDSPGTKKQKLEIQQAHAQANLLNAQTAARTQEQAAKSQEASIQIQKQLLELLTKQQNQN